MDELLRLEGDFYFAFLFVTIAVVALAESRWPRRPLTVPPGIRWGSVFLITGLNLGLLRVLFPVLGVSLAVMAERQGIGLINQWPVAPATAILLSIPLLDFGRWLEHYLLHRVPLLWRLHAMHHTDTDYDFSTGLRFHPFEAVYTAAFSGLFIVALGAPPIAVLLYEMINIIMSIFVHANIRLPERVDRLLRLGLVTPDLHRTHHSADPSEQVGNFAVVSPVWDRLFRTYLAAPRSGHEGLRFGLDGFEDLRHQKVAWMLLNPFLRRGNEAAVPPASAAE